MSLIGKVGQLFENLRKPTIHSKNWAYTSQEHKVDYKFVSGFSEGKSYAVIFEGELLNPKESRLIFLPLTMSEYHKTGLAHVPSAVKLHNESRDVPFEHKGGQIVFFVSARSKDSKATVEKLQRVIIETLKSKRQGIYAYSVGNFFRGDYKDKSGNHFNEKSLSIELLGVSSKVLKELAREIRKEFAQESLLMKDYNTGCVYTDSERMQNREIAL